VTHLGIMIELYPFKGKQIIECFNDIQEIAHLHGLRVNVMDPEMNKTNIDNEPDRLNVRTDKDSVITSFTIG
jgi:hypothetical protein